MSGNCELGRGLLRREKNATEGGAGRFEKPAPDARAAPPEAHESLIGRKTVEEVPLTGLSLQSRRAAGLGETPCTSQKTTTSEGEGRRAGKGLVRAGRQEHATHEPLISSGTAADVPLAGLSLDENRCFLPSVTRAQSRCIAGISTRAKAFAIVPWRVKGTA
jgi:hypothetical protein